MIFKILLVGGIKGYTKNYEHIIKILQNFNSDITISNTQFISLQIGFSCEEADLYIGKSISNYLIVNDELMEKLEFNAKFNHIPYYEKDIINFDKSLNNSFDFVIGEHCWFCDSVEILKYHNLLKLNGYLIRYASSFFPNGDITHVKLPPLYLGEDSYLDEQMNEVLNTFLISISNIFKSEYQNIFKKVNDVMYDITEHNIKYKMHCKKYLQNV